LQTSALFQIKAQPHLQPHFMKVTILGIIALSLATAVVAEEKPAQLKDLKDKVSYSFGLNVGYNLKRQNIELDQDVFFAGMKDALSGRKPLLSEEEVRQTMMTFQQDMQNKQQENAKKNTAESEKFLAGNKTKEAVKTTASGLQYKVLKEGTGAQPKATDQVVVNYRGTLMDGTEFDSSFKRGQPATFPVAAVIKGWTEGLQLMKAGSKYQFFIPPSLAYGDHPPSPPIQPGSALIFEVELLEVKPGTFGGMITPPPSPSPSAK
jgi:FKBP-type peptidyl-prolyl cis-trans isomerase FklB